MKSRIPKAFCSCFLFLLLGCATQRVTTITGSSYNEQRNETNYTVMPYASINMPGKWIKSSYDNNSKQQFFKNDDSVSLAIAFSSIKNYEFNHSNPKKGFEFVQAFYTWEANYFMSEYPVTVTIIEQDSLAKYILWNVKGRDEKSDINSYFLISEHNGVAHNYCIYSAAKWDEQKKLSFLKDLYTHSNNNPQ